MPTLDQIYMITGGIGFFYIIVTAALGLGGDDSDSGDGGDGDAAADSPDASADSGGDAPDGGADAPDGGGGQGHRLAARVSGSATLGPHARSTGLFFAIAKVLSPLRIALILFFFGSAGSLIAHLLPAFSALSWIPAGVIAFFLSNVLFTLLGKMVRRMENTESYRKEDAIGSVGQLSVPIHSGATGEITFVLRGSRTHAPAKSIQGDNEISKSSKVIISDIRDGVYYVEPYNE